MRVDARYVTAGGKRLRCGYTTGACAAMAAGAAAELLLTGIAPKRAVLPAPGGEIAADIAEASLSGGIARCAVRKDSGDDPDITNGVLICAAVRRTEHGMIIDGGSGVGRVTKPGLDQPVGAAAINSAPRAMIRGQVERVCSRLGYTGGMEIVIEIPDGVRLAERTFNPRLGIQGGISVLGTTGIVEPMSERALVESIRVEIAQRAALRDRVLLVTPGKYGADFLRSHPALCRAPAVKCSNFIGEAVDIAAEKGMSGLLLVGHVGKLIKLAAGIFQTHSRYADGRMEILTAHAALAGGSPQLAEAIMGAVTVDAALEQIQKEGLLQPVLHSITEKIGFHLAARAGAMRSGAVFFSERFGTLGETDGAAELIEEIGGKFA